MEIGREVAISYTISEDVAAGPGGFALAIHRPQTGGYIHTGNDPSGHEEPLRLEERQRSSRSRTATSVNTVISSNNYRTIRTALRARA